MAVSRAKIVQFKWRHDGIAWAVLRNGRFVCYVSTAEDARSLAESFAAEVVSNGGEAKIIGDDRTRRPRQPKAADDASTS